MSAFLITYDLHSPGQDYKLLIDYIKSFESWAKLTESCWVVKSSGNTAGGVRDELKSVMDVNDKIIVINITGDGWGSRGLPAAVTDWLKKNL